MKYAGILFAAFVVLSAQTPAPSSLPVRHLTYQFGYNTNVAASGQGTGTTAIDVAGPATNGDLTITGADFWWNTVRPRAKNTCVVHPNGSVACSQAPYALSPIQLTIFSLLARDFFKGLKSGGTGTWSPAFTIHAAVIPGATGFAGQPYTWNIALTMHGKGHAPDSKRMILVQGTGTAAQQGGRFGQGTVKLGILYDPVARVPAFVNETRARLPQTSVYNQDLVQLKLVKLSPAAP